MMKRIAVVLCTYVQEGQIERNCPVRSVKTGKEIVYDENKLDTIKCTLACHKHYDPGMPYDLIIVDNDSDDKDAREFLRQQPNFYSRRNIGFSFGAFEWAFHHFKNDYDYFLFEEQDFAPIKDGWLKELYDTFNSRKGIGAVGNVLEVRNVDEYDRLQEVRYIRHNLYPGVKEIRNFDGPLTFTKTSVLNNALTISPWKLVPCTPHTQGEMPSTINELIFQMPFVMAEYDLVAIRGRFDDLPNCGRVGTYGVRMTDNAESIEHLGDDKLCPMIHCNARLFHPRFKELMSWHNGQ